MMGRKKFLGALVVGAMGAAPAAADVFSENIVEQLERQGFRSIATERTWLGRTRITAEGREGQREIIVNPNTGEILRDLFLTANGGGGGNGGLVNVSKDGQDDDRDRGRDDDDDQGDDNGGNSGDGRSGEDRSGSGGGSSGNGGDSD